MNGRLGRHWLASGSLLLALVLGAGASAQTQSAADKNDGPLGVSGVSWQAEQYWGSERYEELEEMFSRLASPAERLTDGRWQLAAIPEGFAHYFEIHKNWDHALWQIGEWRQRIPNSTAVDIAEAIVLKRAAWSARGGGYSGSVTPEGWKLFKERLERAEAVLLRSKDRASKNPLWFEQYLEVALGLGWDYPQYRALYNAAVATFPEYHNFYFIMVQYLSPRWHGSIEQVDAYIAEAVKKTQAKQGKVMYARLYWSYAGSQDEEFSLFADSGADWRDMREGFEQMMKATPDSLWNLNNFAVFACRANDADTYRRLRKQIGGRVYGDAWPSNYTMEICDERLAKPI